MAGRRFNYTRRRTLGPDEARVTLHLAQDGGSASAESLRRFEFTFEPDPAQPLPPSARVFVEAYRSSPPARMRFDFGTVERIKPPEDLSLPAFVGSRLPPLFRVKVTDAEREPGKLLAVREGITLKTPGGGASGRRGLLWIAWEDIAPLAWSLEFRENGPHLLIDQQVDPDETLTRDPLFRGLIYPEVFRRVFTHLLIDEPGLAEGAIEDEEAWPLSWLALPRETLGFEEQPPPPGGDAQDPDGEERRHWISELVKHAAVRQNLHKALAEFRGNPMEDS